MKKKVLAIIPARSGSKRILNKNIRLFSGKPLISYTIEHALQSKIFDRVIVDTDSSDIVSIAKKYGAEAPFLRPKEMSGDGSRIGETISFLLQRLRKEEEYVPDIIALLQTTSPLRELEDIEKCYEIISNSKVKSVCTICEISPWFYHLSSSDRLVLVNKKDGKTTNTQEAQRGYVLNGCMVYMIKTDMFLKTKKFVDEETVGVVCPRWRSIDLDNPEDWVLAEYVYKNKARIDKAIFSFK